MTNGVTNDSMGLVRLLLDTGCLIAAQEPSDAHHAPAAELLSIAEQGRVRLLVSNRHAYDMEWNTAERAVRRRAWLMDKAQRFIELVPGPLTPDVSRIGHDAPVSDEVYTKSIALIQVMRVTTTEVPSPAWRRKSIDQHHAVSALMAGADLVTTDEKDLWRKRERIREACGLVVYLPQEVVKLLHSETATPPSPAVPPPAPPG